MGLRPKLLQRTANGSRDVRRVELPGPTGIVGVFAVKAGDWRIAKGPGDVGAQERLVTIPSDVTVRVGVSSPGATTTVSNPDLSFAQSKKWVAWISLDPRMGELTLYPPEIASRLERAWSSGIAAIDLGADFFGATVVLRPQLKQNTDRGSRDVRRVVMLEAHGSISVSVIQDVVWRAAT